MEYTSVQKLARVLRVLVIIVFVCNLIALLFVPGFSGYLADGGGEIIISAIPIYCIFAFFGVWFIPYTAMLTLFLWLCGICTAIILWQGKRVLESIIVGDAFSLSNAVCLRKAAVCSFVISAASLLWVVFQAVMNGILTLFSLSSLLVPIFFLAALLFLIMSALFRQAAEIKAENDLTI